MFKGAEFLEQAADLPLVLLLPSRRTFLFILQVSHSLNQELCLVLYLDDVVVQLRQLVSKHPDLVL